MRNPLVVIPGYYGSKLRETTSGSLVWLDGRGLLDPELTMAAIGLDPADPDRVVSAGILDEVAILPPFWDPDVYKGLLTFLRQNLGYGEGELLEFHYDWRKSLEGAAASLERQIGRLLTQTGAGEVDIVAHSFGGLVARAYLEAGGQEARDHVGWLITLGTPHKGMLKTFQAVYSGIKAFTFSAAQTKSTSRGFPSAYELLPTDPADGLFRSAQPGQSPFDDPSWCETAPMRSLLSAAGTTVSDLLPGTLPVDSCLIYGTRRRTTASCQDAGGGTLGFTEQADGDGTVPRVSAMGQGLTGAGRLLRFPCPLGGHTVLFDDRFVQQEILTPILLRRALPDRYLFAHFEREPIFVPRTDNLFVAEVLDQDGRAISGASVTLTLQGTTIRDRVVAEDAQRHDYVLRVRMPGPGVSTRYQVTAAVPGEAEPLRAEGLLVSTRS